jgi:hypothetical protein
MLQCGYRASGRRPEPPSRVSGWFADFDGGGELAQDGSGLGHHPEILFRAGHEPPTPQGTTKATDCNDGPRALGTVPTCSPHLADKTSPFSSGQIIGRCSSARSTCFIGDSPHFPRERRVPSKNLWNSSVPRLNLS